MQGLVKELGDGIAYVEVDASRDTAMARQYQIQAVPTIILLDPSGEIVDTFVGTPGEDELRAAMHVALLQSSVLFRGVKAGWTSVHDIRSL